MQFSNYILSSTLTMTLRGRNRLLGFIHFDQDWREIIIRYSVMTNPMYCGISYSTHNVVFK